MLVTIKKSQSIMMTSSPLPPFSTSLRRLLLAVLTGVAGALAIWLFKLMLGQLEIWLMGSDQGLVSAARALPGWRRFLTPMLGAAAAGGLLWWWSIRRHGSGRSAPADYIEAVTVAHGLLDTPGSLIKCAASLLVVASGSAIGREGAMILLAALTASLIARRCAPHGEWRLLVACGAAAGIAAAYHAPLAGAMFVAEILLGSLALSSIAPIVIAAVSASLTMRLLGETSALYQMTALPAPSPSIYLLLAIFGLFAGLAGALLLAGLDLAGRGFCALKLPPPLQLGLGGALVGALSLAYPEVWGNGYSEVLSLLTAPPSLWLILALLLVKTLAVAASTGSGAPGGVLTPTLFVGAAFGALAGRLLAYWLGIDPMLPTLTLAGMAALLAATTHAPVMAVLLVVEMTGQYSLLPALFPACVLAAALSRRLRAKSVYGLTDAGR